MIEFLKGELAEVTPAYAVVEAGGVGYGLSISLNTYGQIQHEKTVKLYVYESIREDAHVLFGFARKEERKLFELLTSVSGVGPNTARVILSELNTAELAAVISNGDTRTLKGVKGIGLKTAERIIVDLRDKIMQAGIISTIPSDTATPASVGINTEVKDEAVGALTMLGFQAAISNKVVIAILKEHPDMPVEMVVKNALKQVK